MEELCRQSSDGDSWFTSDELHIGLGVYDGVSALVADHAMVDFLWLSSFSVSAALGRPDSGVLDASEMASFVRTVAATAHYPLVVDMDSGYGDPLKVAMATQLMIQSGAWAVCIEDNPLNKRSSLYYVKDRVLASADEHEDRLRAARSTLARLSPGGRCRLIARTEALVAGHGIDEALARAGKYVRAGADAIFVQATKDDDGRELLEFCRRWQKASPVFIAPTRYPKLGAQDYMAAGATHWIFANQAIRAAYRAMDQTLRAVEKAKTGHMPDLDAGIASVSEISKALGARAVGG